MDVSVVCPIHGEGKYLARTLESIDAQSFQGSTEVILVLDRCSEDVISTINRFQSSMSIVMITSNTPGIVAALNLGLQRATGKYVARIDADDVMHTNRIEKQFTYLESNQDVIVLGSSVTEINEVGNIIGVRNYPTTSRDMYKSLSKQCTIAHPSVMFKRKTIIELGSYRSFFAHAEDYDLWLRARDFGPIVTMREALTSYRVHPGQISTLQMKQGVYGSYSARINNMLEKKNQINLISNYITFDNWSNSYFGKFLFEYVNFRLLLAKQFQKYKNRESRNEH